MSSAATEPHTPTRQNDGVQTRRYDTTAKPT
jgi:hypothetical protein